MSIKPNFFQIGMNKNERRKGFFLHSNPKLSNVHSRFCSILTSIRLSCFEWVWMRQRIKTYEIGAFLFVSVRLFRKTVSCVLVCTVSHTKNAQKQQHSHTIITFSFTQISNKNWEAERIQMPEHKHKKHW